MKLLLDTHVLIWSQGSPEKMGSRTLKKLEDPRAQIYLSAISALEVGQLVYSGRVKLDLPVLIWFQQAVQYLGALVIPITVETASRAYSLPGELHRDPADRILVATLEETDSLVLVTSDRKLLRYCPIKTWDART